MTPHDRLLGVQAAIAPLRELVAQADARLAAIAAEEALCASCSRRVLREISPTGHNLSKCPNIVRWTLEKTP